MSLVEKNRKERKNSSVLRNIMVEPFQTVDIVIICLEILIIALSIFFHIQTHATNCRGQLITKTKTPEGLTCTRQAKLSIHEAPEHQTFNMHEQE